MISLFGAKWCKSHKLLKCESCFYCLATPRDEENKQKKMTTTEYLPNPMIFTKKFGHQNIPQGVLHLMIITKIAATKVPQVSGLPLAPFVNVAKSVPETTTQS